MPACSLPLTSEWHPQQKKCVCVCVCVFVCLCVCVCVCVCVGVLLLVVSVSRVFCERVFCASKS